jgi:hypothetical protein
MSNPQYIRDDYFGCMGHAIEEAGEFLAAAGKTLRWGLDSSNPELPLEEQETNADWLLREMRDLCEALDRLKKCFDEGRLP